MHPSPASPQNATLPFPTNPLPSVCREGFFPHQNAKPQQILPYKFFFTSLLFMLFLSIYLSFFNFHFFTISFKLSFLSFFPQNFHLIAQFLFQKYKIFHLMKGALPASVHLALIIAPAIPSMSKTAYISILIWSR